MLTIDTFLATMLYAALGIVIFIVSFMLVDRLTPGELWREIIERKNLAVALRARAIAIGISNIIAAAVHGLRGCRPSRWHPRCRYRCRFRLAGGHPAGLGPRR